MADNSEINFNYHVDNRLRFYSSWDRQNRQYHLNQNSPPPQPTTPHRLVNHHNNQLHHQQQQRQHPQQHRIAQNNYHRIQNSFPVAYWD